MWDTGRWSAVGCDDSAPGRRMRVAPGGLEGWDGEGTGGWGGFGDVGHWGDGIGGIGDAWGLGWNGPGGSQGDEMGMWNTGA